MSRPRSASAGNGRATPSGARRRLFKIRSMLLHVLTLIEQKGLSDQVDMRKVMQTVEEQNGMPVDITRERGTPENGASASPTIELHPAGGGGAGPGLPNYANWGWVVTWRPRRRAAPTVRGGSAAARPSASPCLTPILFRWASLL